MTTCDCSVGLDLGTTGCKAVVLSREGRVLATAGRSYGLVSSADGAAEQDIDAVWDAACQALREVVAAVDSGRLVALGLSGAMHSLVPIDAGDQPIGFAMTWADTRAQDVLAELRRDIDPATLHQQTGCPAQTLYHPARLRWMQQHQPQRFQQAQRFAGIKDVVLHRLTGRWYTDRSLASATGLLGLDGAWHAQALGLAGVTADRLCELVEPTQQVGALTRGAALATGLPADLRVVAGGSDGALSNIGAGAVAAEVAVINVGTSAAVRVNRDEPFVDAAGGNWCYRVLPHHYIVGGAVNNAGLALQWVMQRCFPHDAEDAKRYTAFFQAADTIEPGAGGVNLLPYFTGERNPHWRADATAAILGLTLAHDHRHLARAAIEACCYCIADVVASLGPAVAKARQWRLTGGITRHPLWAQTLADVLGVTLEPIEVADASALGAAILAQVGADGATDDLRPAIARLAHVHGPATSVQPDAGRHEAYRALHQRWQSYRSVSMP